MKSLLSALASILKLEARILKTSVLKKRRFIKTYKIPKSAISNGIFINDSEIFNNSLNKAKGARI